MANFLAKLWQEKRFFVKAESTRSGACSSEKEHSPKKEDEWSRQEIKDDGLVFSFPEFGSDCKLTVRFMRTLRLPDDNVQYPLPPGLGLFELKRVADFNARLPETWSSRGGVFLPMWQAEALWIQWSSQWPFAVKIAAGKINALTGDPWSDTLSVQGTAQDYLVAPEQPWIDGFCIAPSVVRQFVAMPLGAGYTAEEQITGKAEHGGLQITAYPMTPEARQRLAPPRPPPVRVAGSMNAAAGGGMPMSKPVGGRAMGLAAGGLMRQEIYKDPYTEEAGTVWSTEHAQCFVNLMDAKDFRAVVKSRPRSKEPTRADFKRYGLPWFEYHAPGAELLQGSSKLAGLGSVAALGVEKNENPLPNSGAEPLGVVVKLTPKTKPSRDEKG